MLTTTTGPSALRAAGGRTWLPISHGAAALQHRCLSTSSAYRAARIISFGETSTPELSQVLDDYREKVILPTYLSQEQRRKIYNPRIKHILQNDPITMEIDGVVHKFRYRSMVADLPSTRGTLKQIISLLKTPADFQNIPPFLEGCVRARRKIEPVDYIRLVRLAALNGQLQMIMDCVKAADKTGFKLDNSHVINELLAYIQRPAILGGFDEAKTKAALKQVRLVLNILESDEEHHRPGAKTAGAFPYYRDPQVLGARLHMAAARAVHHRGGKDEDGRVARYAEELVALWPENAGLLDLQPDRAYRKRDGIMRYMLDRNTYLFMASPVLNGLTLAAQVVDPALAMQLQNRADAVDSEVKAALASPLRKKGGRGEQLYNAIFNPQAQAEEAEE
ncbi:hypothetical protein MYCTH_2303816 [Thermothelomyces thermophilus ATCC 42464]|uniref:Uncharacterized protein n=1 Tax=Thermothelomyces thermophilus (strain ATCC 42464 / BCRC 31852 / DSM 1799) TaxID=573729 RepID=G2QDT6_THET4|nr:uncharacterized protein MYCTH_2303816 [Thermothelomyces thermophilus ATCC 42464]AEO57545.1 hypothetical protein MYCTH_2303816 [Thermothelomyces thermophilus ATCC 42464]